MNFRFPERENCPYWAEVLAGFVGAGCAAYLVADVFSDPGCWFFPVLGALLMSWLGLLGLAEKLSKPLVGFVSSIIGGVLGCIVTLLVTEKGNAALFGGLPIGFLLGGIASWAIEFVPASVGAVIYTFRTLFQPVPEEINIMNESPPPEENDESSRSEAGRSLESPPSTTPELPDATRLKPPVVPPLKLRPIVARGFFGDRETRHEIRVERRLLDEQTENVKRYTEYVDSVRKAYEASSALGRADNTAKVGDASLEADKAQAEARKARALLKAEEAKVKLEQLQEAAKRERERAKEPPPRPRTPEEAINDRVDHQVRELNQILDKFARLREKYKDNPSMLAQVKIMEEQELGKHRKKWM